MTTGGYSGKSLAAKLEIKPGTRLAAVRAPATYRDLIGPLPSEAAYVDDVMSADIVHLFVADRADLRLRSEVMPSALRLGVALWISWPKKNSPMFVDLTEDGVRAAILPTGWVDVKVCAVDQVWSALKFLRRRT